MFSLIDLLLLLIVALLIVTLMLIEVFFIAGFGLFGVLSVVLFGIIEYYLFTHALAMLGIGFMVVCIIFFLIGFYILSRTKMVDKLALSATINKSIPTIPVDLHIGDRGIALSRLTLSGKAKFNETIIEVTSEKGFINEGEIVEITKIVSGKIYVKVPQETVESLTLNHN